MLGSLLCIIRLCFLYFYKTIKHFFANPKKKSQFHFKIIQHARNTHVQENIENSRARQRTFKIEQRRCDRLEEPLQVHNAQ